MVLLAILGLLKKKEKFTNNYVRDFVYNEEEFNKKNVYDEKTIKYYKTPYFCLDYADLVRT